MSELRLPAPRLAPVTFDGCAGWLHPARGRHGVLLCGALNHEILPLYQSSHALAAMLAEAGLPVLRFDYRGTGDSLGHDREPRRLDAWLASIRAAARLMRDEIGVETLNVVGIRLGATLAALTADEIGVERLALIAPVLSGRLYIREAQARSNMLAGMWRLSNASNDIVNDGFVITRETAAEVSRVNLAALTTKPAREVLILSEKPQHATEKFVRGLEAAGCSVMRDTFAGFAAAMESATLAKIPTEDWRKVVSFLARDRQSGVERLTVPTLSTLSAPLYREERLIFGRNDRLAGVLCRPAAQEISSTLLFLNTGGNPHIGWGRMSVEHARALAADGIASLRMDIAGLGDSVSLDQGPRAALYREASIADIREGLDFLKARGLGNFALVGHCSGAWLALNGAVADPRVRRVFVVNLQRFIWTGKEDLEALMAQAYRATNSYLQEIGSGAIWRRLLNGDINWPRLPGIARSMLRRVVTRAYGRVLSIATHVLGLETETARITKMLERLSARGTQIAFIYSDTDPGREELARHFGAGGRGLKTEGIHIATIANADHDITSEEARERYFDLLLNHVGCERRSESTEISLEPPAALAQAA